MHNSPSKKCPKPEEASKRRQLALLPATTRGPPQRMEPQRRPKRPAPLTARRPSLVWALVLATVAAVLLADLLSVGQTRVEAAPKVKKALKTIVKGLILQDLTTKKHFLPLPVPIPVPIEINDPPVYLKGKPKYVTVYKPKPTPLPIIKPTTVYHMPVYSPTYEYLPVDSMSMYSSMLSSYPPTSSSSSSSSSLPSSAALSSSAAAAAYLSSLGHKSTRAHHSLSADLEPSHQVKATAGSFDDYDDESGGYYVKKSSSSSERRRRQQLAAAAAVLSDYTNDPHRNDEQQLAAYKLASSSSGLDGFEQSGSFAQPASDDDEQMDHDEQPATRRRRMKRQVYYKSGYNGAEKCFGFPLEINVRSKIKLDQVFPIYGKSQMQKCVKVGQPLFPPVQDDHQDSYEQHYSGR